jgi:hypothetical protein
MKAKANEAHKANRRQFLVAAPAAALVAGSIPVAARTASDVSPDLLALLERYAALKAEAERLDAAYKECSERYKAMRPALPDELPTVKPGRIVDWDLYSRVPTDDGPIDRVMHTEAYWRRCGDFERAEIAKAYFAADDLAQQESGVRAAARACDDQMDEVIAADVDVVEFPCRTLGDAISLARFAWEQLTAGEQLLDDLVNYLIAAVLRLDSTTDQTALDEWLSDAAAGEA